MGLTSPRVRVTVELASGVLGLIASIYAWKRTNETDERVPISPAWIVAGAASTVVHHVLYDRNVAGIRERRSRRAIFSFVWAGTSFKWLPDRLEVTFSYSVGSSIGTIAYRLWFGVVRPLPE